LHRPKSHLTGQIFVYTIKCDGGTYWRLNRCKP